jgi:hypothetical protein
LYESVKLSKDSLRATRTWEITFCVITSKERLHWWEEERKNWVGYFAIIHQDGSNEEIYGTNRSIPVNKYLKMGFTAPQNEIAKFLTERIDELVMFRKYNKRRYNRHGNPDTRK